MPNIDPVTKFANELIGAAAWVKINKGIARDEFVDDVDRYSRSLIETHRHRQTVPPQEGRFDTGLKSVEKLRIEYKPWEARIVVNPNGSVFLFQTSYAYSNPNAGRMADGLRQAISSRILTGSTSDRMFEVVIRILNNLLECLNVYDSSNVPTKVDEIKRLIANIGVTILEEKQPYFCFETKEKAQDFRNLVKAELNQRLEKAKQSGDDTEKAFIELGLKSIEQLERSVKELRDYSPAKYTVGQNEDATLSLRQIA